MNIILYLLLKFCYLLGIHPCGGSDLVNNRKYEES